MRYCVRSVLFTAAIAALSVCTVHAGDLERIVFQSGNVGPTGAPAATGWQLFNTNGVAHASAKWTRCGFDPCSFFKFGVASADAADLSEGFDRVERNRWFIGRIACFVDRLNTRQMQH